MTRSTCFTLALLVALGGCGESESPTPEPKTSSLTLAADPGEALSVADALDGKPGDRVVVVGRVQEIVRGHASFRLVDEKLPYCGQLHPERCPTPWDYCCENPDELKALTLFIEGRSPDGQPATGETGLRLLDLVAVRGKLARDEHGNTSLEADGWFRRERPELPDHVTLPE